MLVKFVPKNRLKGFGPLAEAVTKIFRRDPVGMAFELNDEAPRHLKTSRLVEVDAEWTITFCNDRFCQMTGFKREQLVGREFKDLVSASSQDAAARELARRRQEHSGQYELELVRSNGSSFSVLCSPRPVYDSKGFYLGGLGVITDITTLKQAQEALRQSEERYRFIADTMLDLVWMTDRNLRVTYVSPSIEKVLGFTPEERYGQSMEESVTPESLREIHKRFAEELQRESENGMDPDRSIIIETEYYHKAGHTMWMENRVQALRGTDNAIVGIFGVSRDITRRKQAEEKRKKLEAQLLNAKRLEAIGTLAGGIAYEFNNALTGIVGSIELLAMELREDDEKQMYLHAMKRSSDRMSRLTSQLLGYARGGEISAKKTGSERLCKGNTPDSQTQTGSGYTSRSQLCRRSSLCESGPDATADGPDRHTDQFK